VLAAPARVGDGAPEGDAGDVGEQVLQHSPKLLATQHRILKGRGEGHTEFAGGIGAVRRRVLQPLAARLQFLEGPVCLAADGVVGHGLASPLGAIHQPAERLHPAGVALIGVPVLLDRRACSACA